MSEGIQKKQENNALADGDAKVKNKGGFNNRFQHRKPKFEGACADLKDCILGTSESKHIEKYINNVKKIAVYVGQKYNDGGDIRHTIEKLERYTIEEPEPLKAIPSEFKWEVWKRQVAE